MSDYSEYRSAHRLIEIFYGDMIANRSKVPLINHINEGLKIIDWRCQHNIPRNINSIRAAYCLHPIFQNDDDLVDNEYLLKLFSGEVATFVMEYRNVANAGLRRNVVEDGVVKKKPEISPLIAVNIMLLADKIQNRKDFLLHYDKRLKDAKDLEVYFDAWMQTLGVDDYYFKSACDYIKNSEVDV